MGVSSRLLHLCRRLASQQCALAYPGHSFQVPFPLPSRPDCYNACPRDLSGTASRRGIPPLLVFAARIPPLQLFAAQVGRL